MNSKLNILSDNQVNKLSRTTWNQAMIAVTADTMINNGGSASRKTIIEEIERRLIDPLESMFMNDRCYDWPSSTYTAMTRDNYWLTGDGCRWTFVENGQENVIDYLKNRSYNFGFASLEEFIDLLNLLTDPINKPEEIKENVVENTNHIPQIEVTADMVNSFIKNLIEENSSLNLEKENLNKSYSDLINSNEDLKSENMGLETRNRELEDEIELWKEEYNKMKEKAEILTRAKIDEFLSN